MARKKKEESPLDLLPPVTLSGVTGSSTEKQANLITARQSPGFPVAMELISHAMTKRAETIMLDYTREGVAVRYDVDGIWHNLPPRDRESGDAMLAVLKKLANLNVNERRARQEGKLGADFMNAKYICTLTSQGTKTGERVMLKIAPKKPKFSTLEDLGMRDKMQERFKELINSDHGFIVFSAIPGGGLTTTWHVGLNASDRFVRDFVSVEDEASREDEIININPMMYNSAAGQTPDSIIPGMLLKQPDVMVVPELTNGKTLDLLTGWVNKENKLAITRVRAKEAVEALLRVLLYKGSAKEFAKCVTMVLNQRLIRKLCDECKQAFPPPPQLLQKLGIPAGRVQVLYREYQPPPPEQLVDDKGRPIEPPICPKCGGLGYFGRTALFELLVVDAALRDALIKQPKLEVLRSVARKSGHRTIQEEGILLVARGITSIPELQRVMKQ